ncbi:MAG TPA: FecR domain-containing protein [Parasegetibacter sp.]|jgi:transmembrane sensor
MSTNQINWDKLEEYLNGNKNLSLTSEEEAMVKLLVEVKGNQPLLGALANTDMEEAWERFVKNNTQPAPVRPMKRSWLKIAAAAAIAGVFITAGILFFSSGSQNQQDNRIVNTDIDKVTLLLADNKKIELDTIQASIRNGAITIKVNENSAVFQAEDEGNLQIGYNTILVPRGKKFQMELEDGTRVWLNADSKLRFPVKFSPHLREVELAGEGYFEVASAKEKPFIVKYNDKQVKVLGTEFNINAYDNEEAVTLLHGSIEWKSPKHSFILEPNEQIKLTGTNNPVKRTVQGDDYILWTKNTLLLENKSIRRLFEDIARHYNIEVKYAEEISDSIQFSGAFEFPGTIDEMIALINNTGKVITEKKDGLVIVKNK